MLATLCLAFLSPVLPAAAQQKIKVNATDEATKVVSIALTGMNDGVSVGMELIDSLKKNLVDVKVVPGQKALVVMHEIAADIPVRTIQFSELIGHTSPRYAAIHIAEQAALVKLEWWPECAEKSYMIASLTARAWLEMGGDQKALPSFDGKIDDARMAKYVDTFAHNNLPTYAREQSAKGAATLKSLLSANAMAQSAAKAQIKGIEDYMATARCQYDERGALENLDKAQRKLKGLEQEAKALGQLEKDAEAFNKAESEWLLLNRGVIQLQQ